MHLFSGDAELGGQEKVFYNGSRLFSLLIYHLEEVQCINVVNFGAESMQFRNFLSQVDKITILLNI